MSKNDMMGYPSMILNPQDVNQPFFHVKNPPNSQHLQGEKEKEKDQMGVKRNLVEWTPFIAMATVECLDVELSTLSKAAMSRGMNHFVLVGYSNALATLILLPSPFFIDSYTLTFS